MRQDTAGAGPSVYGPWVETDRKGVNTKDKWEYLYPGQPAQVTPQPRLGLALSRSSLHDFFFPSLYLLFVLTFVCIKVLWTNYSGSLVLVYVLLLRR